MPLNVRSALRRLPTLTARLAEDDRNGEVDDGEVDELLGLRAVVRNYLSTRDDAAVAVLKDRAVRNALLRLLAAAVRWSLGAAGGTHGAARVALLEVLQGICARHAALVYGVAMLCSADEGPVYGLPERLLRLLRPGPWRPELLRWRVPHLRASGCNKQADAAEELAAQLEAWAAGGSGLGRSEPDGECWKRLLAAWGKLPAASPKIAEVARSLLPLAEARGVRRACSYPACANLAGDSEADLRLQSCGKCAAAAYCSRACQVAHWRCGHREACGQEAVGG
ncbi:hypothetical protein TSOC_002041 [Tetrabaena socialis]|uniref:phytol kinase n=1 Tax=Tetrabaena socialis TaxID=47790 RepID=A0A2J8AF54_9CHLO|nr:hypothetical protein TSOC_002041 [Tetrabaena socialis]|eukprot:PNH11147.1 hypothetical protein TSOC_002041 [Tetrabaena socialis]